MGMMAQPTSKVEVGVDLPEGGVSEPPASRMRRAQIRIPAAEGQESGSVAVFHFPGQGGDVQGNIDRWYGQFVQPDGSATKTKAEQRTVKVGDLDVIVVSVTGTHLFARSPMMMQGEIDKLTDYRLLGAIVPTSDGPWFFKAVGPKATIDAHAAGFDKLVQSFRLVDLAKAPVAGDAK